MNNPIHNKSFRLRPCVATILLAILAPQAYAAVEPTFPSIPVYLTGGQSSVRPNMLLFMDNSGSMTEVMTDGQRRDVVAKKAAKNVITEYREQYRWGLASFNSNKVQGAFAGATIIKNIEDVGSGNNTKFNSIITAIDAISFNTGTPSTSAYYDLTRYYRGMRLAHTSQQYSSPIQYRCQKNYIIYISDGVPNTTFLYTSGNGPGFTNYRQTFRATYKYPNEPYHNFQPLRPAYNESGPFGNSATGKPFVDSPSNPYHLEVDGLPKFAFENEFTCSITDTCSMYTELGMSHFTEIANTQDMVTTGNDLEGVSFNDPKFRNQTIQTHTIGLGENPATLQNAAKRGGGKYTFATNEAQLIEALKVINSQVNAANPRFASVAPISSAGAGQDITTTETLSLNTEKWFSHLRFYRMLANGRIDEGNFSLPTYNPAQAVTVISTSNGAQELVNTNTTLNNATFALPASSAPAQWQKLTQWLNRKAVTDTTTGYRERDQYSEDRYLGDVIGSNLQAMGVNATDAREFMAVGSNDGMVHVYKKFGAQQSDYQDVFQYIPGMAKRTTNTDTINTNLKFTAATNYGDQATNAHKFFVNGPISWFETFDSNNRTRVALTGTLGEGGRAAYALNIGGVNSSGNAIGLHDSKPNWVANVPLWDTSSQQIGNASAGVDEHMGYTFGEIFNGRLALAGSTTARASEYKSDIRYASVLSSGLNPQVRSDNTYALPSLFVLDSLGVSGGADTNGSVNNAPISGVAAGTLLKRIQVTTAVADNARSDAPRGMTAAVGLDLDNDDVFDVAYAGDQNGNVYRFDFRAAVANWSVERIFKGNEQQPITAAPTAYKGSDGRVTVLFGTGSALYSSDLSDNVQQRFYGIHDPLDDNPAVSGDLPTTHTNYPMTPASNTLVQRSYVQEMGTDGKPTRNYQQSSPVVNFSKALHTGWFVNLTNNGTLEGERVLVRPEVAGSLRYGGTVLFNTAIFKAADTTVTNSCTPPAATASSGFMMAFDAESGSRPTSVRFVRDNLDWVGMSFSGKLSSLNLVTGNQFVQNAFGTSRSGKNRELGNLAPAPDGCRNNVLRIGLGTDDGPFYIGAYCQGTTLRRISWREIF